MRFATMTIVTSAIVTCGGELLNVVAREGSRNALELHYVSKNTAISGVYSNAIRRSECRHR